MLRWIWADSFECYEGPIRYDRVCDRKASRGWHGGHLDAQSALMGW